MLLNNDFIKASFSHWTRWSYHDFAGFSSNIKSTFTAFGNSKI
ncbi:hypothetical protein P344_00665 [Spiroplasma mirum ATCC 29335]|uniref:Uncharacterized protein n=1 Tax=Spiroplasma mirum ATCC 29335 TaxID=838561 RepID=W6AKE7_9MOLU|nr:hypothetical protein [Spiroplasma atrichopogonis]AHI57506.1 hypothetical protein P344_00665 [Spiroplasma mirum ATCC 29335]